MSINQEILPSLLQWSSFPILFSMKDVVCIFNILITTRVLSQTRISEDKTDRHKIISNLSNDGFSDKQISEYLNEHQINTPTGLEYYPRLIWITRKKMRKTEERSLDIKSNHSEIGFYI